MVGVSVDVQTLLATRTLGAGLSAALQLCGHQRRSSLCREEVSLVTLPGTPRPRRVVPLLHLLLQPGPDLGAGHGDVVCDITEGAGVTLHTGQQGRHQQQAGEQTVHC